MQIQKIDITQSKGKIYNSRTLKNPTFKRDWSEHTKWGAKYIKEKGKTNFTLFSFPDAKGVFLEITNKATVGLDNVKSRIVNILLAAGFGCTLKSVEPVDNKSKIYPMKKNEDGVFTADNIEAKPDDMYRFIVVDNNKNISLVKDPYSKKQYDINGWSTIYDSDKYEWKNTNWIEGKDKRRIIRKPDEPSRGLENLVIEEINIPTLSDEGTFDSAKSRIDKIAERGIATAIEIMPVENTFSLQWGYDGVDKFAVNEKLGGADKLKEFVDYIHGKGLNVIIDMVPNHIGPDGDTLAQAGPYEKGAGQFGGEFNYEGKNNRYVRDWMTNAALWWAKEFKADGLRLDMTKMCGSDYLLMQIVQEVNEHCPDVFLIAEDGRENKESVTRYETHKKEHGKIISYIDSQVDLIANDWPANAPGGIGFDSEWDFRFMQTMKKAILEPGSNLLDDIDDRIKNSAHRVKYVMSHDEIGNWDGTRLIQKVLSNHLNLFLKVNGENDAEKGQRAAQASQKLVELIVSSDFESLTEQELKDKEELIGLNTFISKDSLIDAMNTGLAKQKLAQGTVMTIPGPKMYFQGDDDADLSQFKFFREFSDEANKRKLSEEFKNNIIKEKGYDTILSEAREDSIIGKIKPQGLFKDIQVNMETFNKNLKELVDSEPALKNGTIEATYKDGTHNVHIHQLKSGDNEILVIKNFGYGFHDKNYMYQGFPQYGVWESVFSSDAKEYGGSNYTNYARKDITHDNQNLSLAPNSFIVLKRIK